MDTAPLWYPAYDYSPQAWLVVQRVYTSEAHRAMLVAYAAPRSSISGTRRDEARRLYGYYSGTPSV